MESRKIVLQGSKGDTDIKNRLRTQWKKERVG